MHVGHETRTGGLKNANKLSVRKPDVKRPSERLRGRCEDNIRCRTKGWLRNLYLYSKNKEP